MKPLVIFLEFDVNCYGQQGSGWKPFYFKGRFKDGYFIRFGWICVAFAFVRMSLYEYNRYIESGSTEWRTPKNKLISVPQPQHSERG